jgi:hypothetical protein
MADDKESIQEIEERINKAWSEIVIMEDRLKALPGQVDNFNNSLKEIQSSLEDSKEAIDNINSHYEDYFEKTDPSIKTKLEKVVEHHTNIDKFLKAATEIKEDLEEFKEFIYGDESLKKDGFKKELEQMFAKAKTANDNLNKSWTETYQTLYEKIEGLLPGATSTGLSKAYQEQNKNYKGPVIMWSFVFGLTVLAMMIFGVYFYADVAKNGESSIQDSLQHILARLPFFIPAVWLAIFASKQQSQYKRLQQEYVYKETLSKSYEAYKREIDQLPDSDEKNILHQKLIEAMVDMCGYNPSLTLEHKSHDDKPPIPGTDFLKSIRPKKKQASESES